MIDFHMHPVGWVPEERRLSEVNCIPVFEQLVRDMDRANIDKGLVMLLDENWFRADGQVLKQFSDRLYYCALFDIGRAYEKDVVLGYVQRAARIIKGVKIHPKLQTAEMEDYMDLVWEANKLGLFTVVHADGDEGVKIAENLAKMDGSLIVAHSGGVDFSRIVCLADKHENVMLDLSFMSLPKLEGLLMWGIEVLGPDRFLFGSDHPYCDVREYKEKILEILQGLPFKDTEKIMGGNALKILGGRK